MINHIVEKVNLGLNAKQVKPTDRCISVLDGLPADDGSIEVEDKNLSEQDRADMLNKVPAGFQDFKTHMLYDTIVVNRAYALIDSIELTNNRDTR